MTDIETEVGICNRIYQSSLQNTLLQGSGIAFLIQMLGTGLKYFFQVLLARWMGPAEYGVFSYAFNWTILLTVVAGFGFSSSAVRFVPEYVARQDWQLLKGYLRRSSQLVFIVGLLITVVGTVIVGLYIKESERIALLIAFIIVPLFGLATHQGQLLRGMKDIFLAFTPMRVLQPVFAIAIAFLALHWLGLLTSATALIATALSVIFVIAIQTLGLRWIMPIKAQDIVPVYSTQSWITVSMPMMVTAVAYAFITQIDVIMIGLMLEPAQVGVYAAAAKTSTLVSFLLVSVNAIVAPLIAELYALKEIKKLTDLARTATLWMFLPTLLIAAGLALFGRYILGIFGSEFVGGYWPLMILVIGQLVNALTGPVGYLTELTGHQSQSAKVYLISAILCGLLNLVLIPVWGIIGSAIATATTFSISNIWLRIIVYKKILMKDNN